MTAMDADGDVRNYTLTGTIPQVGGENAFKIDQGTGQIMTAVALDHDAAGATRTFTLIVRATDSAGGATVTPDDNDTTSDDATVTITLLNVNDAPGFVAPNPDPSADVDDNVSGMAADKAEEGNGVIWTAAVSDYGVDDPEGVDIGQGKWSLEGADKDLFELDGDTDNIRTLEFKEKADFENPMDSDKDNIYEVTVVASDGQEMAKRAVTVKITDSDEAGMIELSDENPVTGTAVEATLEDSDGDVINVNWKWYALETVPATDELLNTAIDDATALKDVTSNGAMSSYTPKAGDIGKHLVARATYMDRTEDEDNSDNPADLTTFGEGGVRFNNTSTSAVTAAVIDDPANAAPEFEEGATATRYVEENSDDERPNRSDSETVGALLMIKDADGVAAGSHTYTLSGTDAASFEVDAVSGDTNGAQLMTKAALDYETKKTYTVVVTVEDSSNESNDTDSITVTIQVKDLDEKPEIQKGGLDIAGLASVDYDEGDTDAAASYTVTGPMADDAEWSLEGDDAADFSITGGMLKFNSTPDYEMPVDADMNNTYMVTVKADDGTYMDMMDVTVMVTNKNEDGVITLSSENPVLGIELTATLSDPDGSVTGEAWQWSKSMDMEGTFEDIEDATAMSYTPVEADGGYYLMVKVTYTDGHGPGKMAMETTDAKVITNTAPEFRDGVSTTRSVMEGSAAGASVGSPVAATDAEDDALTYTLGGDDAASFALGEPAGQITVREGTMLDDDVTDSYSVTVTVSDGEESDSIDVTINVTDMQFGCSGPSAADCEALLEAMPKLEGADSTRSLNWAVGTPIAEWDGVRKLSESGRVEWLYLHGVSAKDATDDAPARAEVKLNGTIAVELGDLDGLTRLYLHRNNLTGGIPGELSGLTNLVWLRLYDNMLSGEIPDLSGMDSLERLYIHENDLSGEIPMSLGSLSRLTHMQLQRNDLDGEIPAMLGEMDTLVWLSLYDNGLIGEIPMSLGSLSSLKTLYLHGNMLSGEVPEELGNLSSLTNLWLKKNSGLSGQLPMSLDSLTKLERVRIKETGFTGCIPAALATAPSTDSGELGLPTCQ